MLAKEIAKNRLAAFERLAELKKADKTTVTVNGDSYSYTTKRGVVKTYAAFASFAAYRASALYPNKADRVNGFWFVLAA